MDELRARIAYVIGACLADDLPPGHISLLDVADTLIRELGFTQRDEFYLHGGKYKKSVAFQTRMEPR